MNASLDLCLCCIQNDLVCSVVRSPAKYRYAARMPVGSFVVRQFLVGTLEHNDVPPPSTLHTASKSRILPSSNVYSTTHRNTKHCRSQLCSQSLHSTIIDTTILSTTLERSQSEVTKGYDRTHHIQVWFPKSLLLMLLPPTITLLAASTMTQLQLQHPALFQSQRNISVH